MSMLASATLLLLLIPAGGVSVDPVSQALAMISKLQQDIILAGEQEQKTYYRFSRMCSGRSRELHQEIKTGKANLAGLTAAIDKATADLAALQMKISDGGDQISDADSDLRKATSMRSKESAAFKLDEQQLQTMISSIERAMVAIERAGPGTSLAQVDHMQTVTQVLQTMVEAATIESSSAAALTALLQASSSDHTSADTDEEDDTSAPAAAAYEGQSSSVVETLEGLLDKARHQLEEGRQTETKSVSAYQLLKQSLEAKLLTLTQAMDAAKKSLAETQETKASSEGDHEATAKDLAEDVKELKELHHECLDRATSFEDATSSRDEELSALAKAKNIITETTGGATKQRYNVATEGGLEATAREVAHDVKDHMSFLQVRSTDMVGAASDALHVVRRLAFDAHSKVLMELTNRMTNVIRSSASTGGNPFAKVQGLINSMIRRLEAEAESEAAKKAHCDKELAESGAKKEKKEDRIGQLSTRIDVMASASKKLKGEVMQLNKELAALARTQAEAYQLRTEEKANYNRNKPIMEQGLEGVKTALKVLREYYATDERYRADLSDVASSGSAKGIIGMLEVIESDFSKSLAVMNSAEQSAESEYEAATQENAIARVTKEQDAKYKTSEHISLDKSISEAKADKAGVGEELDAVLQYLSALRKDCIAQVDPYEVRKKRREDEMAGLREALDILSGESVLLQLGMSHTKHRTLRGAGRTH